MTQIHWLRPSLHAPTPPSEGQCWLGGGCMGEGLFSCGAEVLEQPLLKSQSKTACPSCAENTPHFLLFKGKGGKTVPRWQLLKPSHTCHLWPLHQFVLRCCCSDLLLYVFSALKWFWDVFYWNWFGKPSWEACFSAWKHRAEASWSEKYNNKRRKETVHITIRVLQLELCNR